MFNDIKGRGYERNKQTRNNVLIMISCRIIVFGSN